MRLLPNNCLEVNIKEEKLLLLPEKAIFWEKKEILLIADLHIGKTHHFRANGLAVPIKTEEVNWKNLNTLIDYVSPKRILILGDLFHSAFNKEVSNLKSFCLKYPMIDFELVIGNHDILGLGTYEDINLTVHPNTLTIKPFLFSHEPITSSTSKLYNLSGHIHPSVMLKGKGRSKHRLPCFYFSENYGLLPAFGAFTGTADIKPSKSDQVYLIAEGEIIAI